MNTYDAGESFSLSIDISQAGAPSSATYRVVDHAGVLVIESTPLEVYGDDESLTVHLEENATTLAEGQRRKLLTIHLEVTDDEGGRFKFRETVIIQSQAGLIVPAESFQSVSEALLVSMDVFEVPHWEAAGEEDRRKALIEAAHRINQLKFSRLEDLYCDDMDRIDVPAGWYPDGCRQLPISDLPEAVWVALPSMFIADLKVAQVIEADSVLSGETAEEKRLSGILSDTVGETSQMFRTGKPMELPVSKRTMRRLARWVDTTWRVGRG
ncbi:hypothetical protein TW86_03920 [Halomonas sp. S2151]|uniref:hypothetical protein n=1 Tax=Halomonas sp. S2151 TaxID=579478 RepID=UPI0005F9FA71|nr:hypothetical protein [Halomonas sp. S2151]KJZ17410.1 hypothetical protein TW86_03920 [Halomonas sp. S2151]